MNERISSPDQRRHPRTPVGASFDFALPGAPEGRCRGVIADLSAGGMTFESDAELEEGMTLHLRLSPALQLRGEVRHAGSAPAGRRRYGVRFHKIGYVPTN
ncbi:MAG: PilZ domain-containing protein [Elusimicrobia bacterium]|nr:PilZ domain-containing protein [Elusimicrobiota bacterium]